jgi:hypothetical protein
MTHAPQTFEEFWPIYLQAHQDPKTRGLHFAGTGAGILVGGIGLLAMWKPTAILAGFIIAYTFAWIGHALFEHNRPATLSHPLWSLRGDIRMFWLWLTGRLSDELQKAGAQ